MGNSESRKAPVYTSERPITMSTVRGKHDLSLSEQSAEDQPTSSEADALSLKHGSMILADLDSCTMPSDQIFTKSESQMEMESKARQKEIDRKLLLAEKVHV